MFQFDRLRDVKIGYGNEYLKKIVKSLSCLFPAIAGNDCLLMFKLQSSKNCSVSTFGFPLQSANGCPPPLLETPRSEILESSHYQSRVSRKFLRIVLLLLECLENVSEKFFCFLLNFMRNYVTNRVSS